MSVRSRSHQQTDRSFCDVGSPRRLLGNFEDEVSDSGHPVHDVV
jgi:hypothetical protein